jgi:3-deoxy-D-manno-octulosonate 8-phosphate phosphatase (KDO 8-P phosphatase)
VPASSDRRSARKRAGGSALRAAAAIRLLVLDVDGVLTDGRLWFGARGEVLKAFHVRDGHGIRAALAAGIRIVVLSGRRSPAVARRCAELGIRSVLQGVADKHAAFERIRSKLAIAPAECACIGDDAPDVPLMQAVGLAFAVADAHGSALAAAHHVTRRPGGHGAVREVCDRLLEARGLAP